MKFKIVLPTFNMSQWIGENIAMLRRQEYGEFDCVVVDDLSTDGSADAARAAAAVDSRFSVITNPERMYALGSLAAGIEHLSPGDADVVVVIDGDDRLYDATSLAKVAAVYSATGCWLTYGSLVTSTGEYLWEFDEYPPRTIERRSFRRDPWHANHLRTFKYGLWRRIRPDAFFPSAQEIAGARMRALLRLNVASWAGWSSLTPADLTNPDGRYFKRSCDKAAMFPLLEMAGGRSYHVKDTVYVFRVKVNDPNTGVTDRSARWQRRLIREILATKDKHPLVDAL